MQSDQVISELVKKVDFLPGRLSEMEKENRALSLRIQHLESFKEEYEVLRQDYAELQSKYTDLQTENAELEARLNSNSRNSNKPPSSDGYKKQPAFPKKKKGKQGGQHGHKGRTLQQVEHPDEIVKHKPDSCNCGHVFKDEELVLSETRQVFDFPQPHLEVVEHQLVNNPPSEKVDYLLS